MAVLPWAITALVVLLLVTFAWSVVSLRTIPLGRRPRTMAYDRFGRPLGLTENPDYHANPGEDHAEGPDEAPQEGERRRRDDARQGG
ncbi:MAG TPA: hypothetical protein VFL91_25230 [Thermomicrobiales bacterium]|nr:hypothetical protein [Thermomicrobiales bacterium]